MENGITGLDAEATGLNAQITGQTAGDIADSIRNLVDAGLITPGQSLPRVRELAQDLGVNRNTIVAAYRHLIQAGIAIGRGRGGTLIRQPETIPEEGFAPETVLHDIGSGNPNPKLLPDLGPALATLSQAPVLYGQPVIDPGLAEWATQWIAPDQPKEFQLSVLSGSVDAIERLLGQALTHGDSVALEDPCFLTSVHTVRLAGYKTVPVPVDAEGMTVEGLRAALESGARAVVCTPRAHNPTGAGLTAERAKALREILADYPYVLVIEDDHFSLLAHTPYHSIIGPNHARWALVRSVSKFLGPDLRLALTAADPETAQRLAKRLSPGTMWVSHLLQRLAHQLLASPDAQQTIAHARTHYQQRNAAFTQALASHGITASAADGLNVWVRAEDARATVEQLMRRGWLARAGTEFALTPGSPAENHLRLTIHDLDEEQTDRLITDLVAACTTVGANAGGRSTAPAPSTSAAT